MTETKVKYLKLRIGRPIWRGVNRVAAAGEPDMTETKVEYNTNIKVDVVVETDVLAKFADSDCWACQLAHGDLSQHKSRWFYIGGYGAVVEDLDPKGSALRLLYVPKEHVSVGQETVHMRNIAKSLLAGIARALAIENNMQIGKLDLGEHSYDRHWHAQICLEWDNA